MDRSILPFSQRCGRRDLSKSRIVLLSIAIVLIGAAAFPPSLGDAAAWENTVTRWTYIPVFLLPIIIGCADRIKKKK